MRATWRHDLARVFLTSALYFGLGEIGARLADSPTSPSPVFLPAGVALGATMRWGTRAWPGVMIGTMLLALSFGFAAGATLVQMITCPAVAVVTPWLVRRAGHARFRLDTYRDVLFLLLAALLAGGMSALINPPLLTALGVETMTWRHFVNNVGIWWLGDAVGVLLVTPLFLVLRTDREAPLFPIARTELVWALGALIVICGINFNGWLGRDFQNVVFILAPYPVLIWIGIRLHRPAAMVASIILATMSVYGTSQGWGPFAQSGSSHNLFPLSAFLAVSTLSLLLLSVAMAERRSVEIRLAHQSNLLHDILQHLPGAVYWKNSAGVYLGCNLEYARLAGAREPADLIGKSWHEMPETPLLRGIDGAADEQVMRTGSPRLAVEVTVDQPDGPTLTFLTNKLPLRDGRQAVIGMIGTAVDVTALKLADQLVHKHLNRLKHFIDRLPAGAVYVEGEKLHFNSKAEAITGYTNEEIPTRDAWFERLFPTQSQRTRAAYEANRALGFPHPLEVQLTRRDGHLRWVEIRRYRDDQGEIWVLHDTSERHRAEDALRDRELELAHVTRLSTLGEMVAEIAHEINQPLYAISNFSAACLTTLASEQADKSELLKEWLGKIHGQAEQAGTIIRRLRNMVAPTAPQAAELNLVAVIEEVLELLASDARKSGIQTRTEFPPDIPNVIGDRVQLQQILINLVKNAYEAVTEVENPRLVAIELRPREKEMEVVIADNGPGFTEESEHHMFDAFFTTKSRGMGMGLPICRSLVTAHGGRLWIEPAQPRGAELHFTLPRADVAE